MKKVFSKFIATCLLGGILLAGCSSDEAAKTSSDKKEEFLFGMDGLYKPFNYQENNELKGFDLDIGYAMAEKMGMKPVPVLNPWATIIEGLNAKKYDAILGSMSITEERKKVVNFTKPYYYSGAQVFVAETNNTIKSVEDIRGKKIGAAIPTNFMDMAKEYTTDDKIVGYEVDLTALMDLPSGRADAVISDELAGAELIASGAVKIKPVGKPLTLEEMGIAVRKDDKELLDKLNKALDEIIEDGTYAEISIKWFGRDILQDK